MLLEQKLNYLELYKIKLQNGLKNEYLDLNDNHKKTGQITLRELDSLIEIL